MKKLEEYVDDNLDFLFYDENLNKKFSALNKYADL